jgi:hypothetical protein
LRRPFPELRASVKTPAGAGASAVPVCAWRLLRVTSPLPARD